MAYKKSLWDIILEWLDNKLNKPERDKILNVILSSFKNILHTETGTISGKINLLGGGLLFILIIIYILRFNTITVAFKMEQTLLPPLLLVLLPIAFIIYFIICVRNVGAIEKVTNKDKETK